MPACYILYSQEIDRYYIGCTNIDLNDRLAAHNELKYGGKSFSSRAQDWLVYHFVKCTSLKQARAIEKHIKKMKSRRYLENLPKYPEITINLLNKYS